MWAQIRASAVMSIRYMETRMALSEQRLQQVLKKLHQYAEEQTVRMGDGLRIGLVNYSTNVGISDLAEDELEQVLRTLGEISIDLAARGLVEPRIANGQVLSRVLRILCGAYDHCKRASEKILGRRVVVSILGVQMNPTDEEVLFDEFAATQFVQAQLRGD